MRTIIFAMTMIVVAAPAAAAAQTAKQGAANSNGVVSVVQERKYCIQYEAITGSRTADKQECKTKAQWARQGINVDKPARD